ncbi:AT-rich interactive domain-containing protein 6-like isoform X1 [Trifolium pratense]|nr:AT-rich interactive domain-containing protein 6-like isoform X1 [Trifolium pratense]XP_045813685.1 AT-rich interactive domain-containing protein 6-like isoform X1 [Trifolium pratense]
MSDTKEKEEAVEGVPAAVSVEEAGHVVENESSNQVSTSPQLRDDDMMIIDNLAGLDSYLDQEMHLEVQPVVVEEPSMNVENVLNDVKIGKAELAAEDENVKPKVVAEDILKENIQDTLHSVPVEDDTQILITTEGEDTSDVKVDAEKILQSDNGVENDDTACQNGDADAETTAVEVEVKPGVCEAADGKTCDNEPISSSHNNPTTPQPDPSDTNEPIPSSHKDPIAPQTCDNEPISASHNNPTTPQPDPSDTNEPIPSSHNDPIAPQPPPADVMPESKNVLEDESKAGEEQAAEPADNGVLDSPQNMYFLDPDHYYDGNEPGTEEDQAAFMKELENFFRERGMDFKPPKFYGETLNCLKLWRSVIRLGGYEKVTSCKLWRQVGESFKPPKTCTTVSWTFRGFYEKALLDYERQNIKGGEMNVPIASPPEPANVENQAIASGRARRYAAEQAMRGWHSQRLLGNGEVSDPIIKDRNSVSVQKREKQLKSINILKRKKPSYVDNAVKAARSKPSRPQLETSVDDIGPPADWVKVNVQKTKDCFEIYALVPGLLREEVRVQSDPAGRLVISGEPEHPNNPWGVTPFKKVVSLPSRIDPHQTSAVVTLHGQLFVRVPFEQSE